MHAQFALIALLTAVLCCPQSALAKDSLTVTQAETEVRVLGAQGFIDKYFDQEAWSWVLRGIESANPRWLAVGEALKPHSDAGSSEELGQAFFNALAINPLRVLPVLIRVYGSEPEELCNQTFEAELPRQGVNTYLSAIEAGLKHAKTATEKAYAAKCLRGLHASRKYARENGLR